MNNFESKNVPTSYKLLIEGKEVSVPEDEFAIVRMYLISNRIEFEILEG
jgi:hypothetical protein